MGATSNYALQLEQWRARFLGMDAAEICRRLPDIERADGALKLRHFGRRFRIELSDGRIRADADAEPVDMTPQLNIYTLLWYAKPGARLTGDWQPFKRLRGASPFERAFQAGTLEPLAQMFSGREGALEAAVAKLRGQRISESGFALRAFECIPVRLNFWDADDEFPAQANLLFDSSAPDFIHVRAW